MWHKGQGICTACIHCFTLLVYAQPYGCFIFLNCTTVVMSQPKINCIHFHCPFYEGCIKLLNDSITQIMTFSFMWNYFTNFVLLYTWLIDNHIQILEYFPIVAWLKINFVTWYVCFSCVCHKLPNDAKCLMNIVFSTGNRYFITENNSFVCAFIYASQYTCWHSIHFCAGERERGVRINIYLIISSKWNTLKPLFIRQ